MSDSDIEAVQDPRRSELKAIVVAGGTPTREQAAALAVALLTIPAGQPASQRAPMTGWQQAALLEGTGARRFSERADLDRPQGMS